MGLSFETSGKIEEIYPVNQVNDRFRKKEFILEITENKGGNLFTEYIKFQLTQEKCTLLDPFKKGDRVKLSFNLTGRKWEKSGNYFTNLDVWRIEAEGKARESGPVVDFPSENFMPPSREEDTVTDIDDLPF
jgi:hypothetical protein